MQSRVHFFVPVVIPVPGVFHIRHLWRTWLVTLPTEPEFYLTVSLVRRKFVRIIKCCDCRVVDLRALFHFSGGGKN